MKKIFEYIIDKNKEIVPVGLDNTGIFQKIHYFLMDYISFYNWKIIYQLH